MAARENPHPGHDPERYGQRLPYRRIEEMGPCTAVAVQGTRLFAIGQGRLQVLDIRYPGTPSLLGTLDGLGTTRRAANPSSAAIRGPVPSGGGVSSSPPPTRVCCSSGAGSDAGGQGGVRRPGVFGGRGDRSVAG